MLFRKIERQIREYLESDSDKVLVVQGARQVGKSYIIRHIGREMFPKFVEINLVEDKAGDKIFANISNINDFYFKLSMVAGDKLSGGTWNDSLVFLDEIQEYPHLLTLLKFLNADHRYRFVASGSLLGVTLNSVTSIPVGSLRIMDMYPLDFEEFLIANGVNEAATSVIKTQLMQGQPLDDATHARIMDLFRKYLVVGGLPDAVNQFVQSANVVEVRAIQQDIIRMYSADASKYDFEHRLKIRRIYDLIPSNMENKKKRMVAKEIEGREGRRFSNYHDEFEYLISSGTALEVMAVANPKFPLAESMTKNLLKLYLNDPGLLTSMLYSFNINAVMADVRSVNLGSVYESVVASELKAHGHKLFYYDNKKKGEVDFLINDFSLLSVVPIEVKSGKDYTVHSAIDNLISVGDYAIERGYVLSNQREIRIDGKVWYLPIYAVMAM